jgi:hypothetical protein
MAIIREWKCARHGDFEGSHPLCPEMGCDSARVERAFRTPVAIGQGKYARFDAGLRKSADMMGIDNWKTARPGETGFAGRAPIGARVLWGDEVAKEMGAPLAEQMAVAARPLSVAGKDPATDPYLTVNNGMRATANELGITKAVRPPAETTIHRSDVRGRT